MAQIEGSTCHEDAFLVSDCEDPKYMKWLQTNKLIKFYTPLKECLGIDSIDSCTDLDISDIPRVCQNIPNDTKMKFGITFKDELLLKKHLKLLIRKHRAINIKSHDESTKQNKKLNISLN